MTDINEPRNLPPIPVKESFDLPTTGAAVTAEQPTSSATDTDESNEFEFVRLPNGKVVAVSKSDIQEVPATATSDAPKPVMAEVVDPHYYVWLNNGEVRRVKQSDLPGPAGGTAHFGHWQEGNKVYLIVGVYPVEDIVKGDN